jgi:hypothetical protein
MARSDHSKAPIARTTLASVIFRSARVSASELERQSGWRLRPEGLCREDRCVPFVAADLASLDLVAVGAALGLPLVHDARHELWAFGAEAGGHALVSAAAPDFELPDADGGSFRLSSLRGQKVLLVAWASW